MIKRPSVHSLFARHALSLRLPLLVPCALLLASLSALADNKTLLNPLPALTIIPTQEFSYRLVPIADDGQALAIRLINAPQGARVEDAGDGSSVFHWTPPASIADETIVLVQVFDALHPSIMQTQRLVLRRGNQDAVTIAKVAATDETKVTVNNAKVIVNAAKYAVDAANYTINTTAVAPITNVESVALAKPNTNLETGAPVERLPNVETEPTIERMLNVDTIAPVEPVVNAELLTSAEPSTNATSTSTTTAQAPTLPEISHQVLQVGDQFQLFVRSADAEGNAVKLIAQSLPKGAALEPVFDASQMLSWRPDKSQIGEHRIALVAIDELAALRTERTVVLTVVSDLASVTKTKHKITFVEEAETKIPTASVNSETVALNSFFNSIGDLSEPLDDALYFEPLSSQIVSVGHTVRFKVEPRTADYSVPFLHVDRLPRNASFDENPDGTRTFYWKTTSADQGSHIFRFTAIHPNDVNLRVITETMIVVGDPGVPGSLPNAPADDVVVSDNDLGTSDDSAVSLSSELK